MYARDSILSMDYNRVRQMCKALKRAKTIGLIYMFESPSTKKYIGQTTTARFLKRMSKHKSRHSPCTAFKNAIAKYGFENMQFSIIDCTDDVSLLDSLEIKHIKEQKSYGKMGYNLTTGGEGACGYKYTPEQKQKMSLRIKRHYEDHPESREEMSRKKRQFYKDNPSVRMEISRERKAYLSTPEGKLNQRKASLLGAKACRKTIIATNTLSNNSFEFESAREAKRVLEEKHNTKFCHQNISSCALGKKGFKTVKGYTFQFKN